MDFQAKTNFDSKPYKEAISKIKNLERKMLREIREEAEKQDKQKETANSSKNA